MLTMVLMFGLAATGYGQSVDGTWYWEDQPNDPDTALKLNNGRIDSDFLRGTYTTRNNEITYKITHYLGAFFQVFGQYFAMSGVTAFEWYSREQMGNLLRNHPLNVMNKPSAQDINEMLDTMYPTETVPIIGGNRFTLDYLNFTYIKRNAPSQQQNQPAQSQQQSQPKAQPTPAPQPQQQSQPAKPAPAPAPKAQPQQQNQPTTVGIAPYLGTWFSKNPQIPEASQTIILTNKEFRLSTGWKDFGYFTFTIDSWEAMVIRDTTNSIIPLGYTLTGRISSQRNWDQMKNRTSIYLFLGNNGRSLTWTFTFGEDYSSTFVKQ